MIHVLAKAELGTLSCVNKSLLRGKEIIQLITCS